MIWRIRKALSNALTKFEVPRTTFAGVDSVCFIREKATTILRNIQNRSFRGHSVCASLGYIIGETTCLQKQHFNGSAFVHWK